ncbi:MAG: transporter substrate-binding domain-containing protein [Anaerolineae bacterium]|nr:transporter substrate-binding domain-containing protein [Anaerolineae bacterium]MCO5242718.1 amino acid ABC transporter substrate-binding protein [Anaerolineae bacterium]
MRKTHLTLVTLLLVAAMLVTACGASGTPAAEESSQPAPAEQAPAEQPADSAPAEPEPQEQATGKTTLDTVKERGKLVCGVNQAVPGFGFLTPDGEFEGFDVDACKAVAAAVLGDANAVEYRALTAQDRFPALANGEIDLLSRNTTWTMSRDTSLGFDFTVITFYDGQGMMVRKADNIKTLQDLEGASICVQTGTTTELNLADQMAAAGVTYTPVVFPDAPSTVKAYEEGQCDAFTTDKSGLVSQYAVLANPDDHEIMDVTLSKEPLGPVVRHGDNQWKDIVTWTLYGLIAGEEFGITSQNVDEFMTTEEPEIKRLLGVEGDLGVGAGISNDFAYQAIKQVGNYGEIYDRHLAVEPFNLVRAQNALYKDGGLMYSPPFR